jgi:hypothetical protein
MNRRHFVKHMAGAAAATVAGQSFVSNLQAAAPAMRRAGKHLVILWMGGGPSHMDTWTIQTGSQNQGDFKAIETAAQGVRIGELMENTAKEFRNLSVIRTLNSREGDHMRGTYRLNHAFPPSTLGVNIPGVGAIASHFSARMTSRCPAASPSAAPAPATAASWVRPWPASRSTTPARSRKTCRSRTWATRTRPALAANVVAVCSTSSKTTSPSA